MKRFEIPMARELEAKLCAAEGKRDSAVSGCLDISVVLGNSGTRLLYGAEIEDDLRQAIIAALTARVDELREQLRALGVDA